MNLEIQSRLSFYRRLEEVEHKKGISLVRHIETGQIYVEKVLTQYDKSIYDWLQQSKLPYVPQIYECMEEDGTLYLIDFNTARVFDAERNRDTELIGTRGFAAPEQYGFSQSDARTDIYGLGVLLNYMLCGKLIRDGIYADHQEVSQIIRKATQIDPEKRYQTAEEMLDAMQQSMILDEATDKVSLNDKSRPAWTRFLPPGFREGKILNMVVAAIYYIFWMYFCLTVEVKDHGEPLSGTWLYVNRFVYFMMFIITPFFWNNYLDVWNYFPLVRSPKKIWKLVGLFLYTLAWFFLVMFVFVIVEDIFR